MIDDCDLVVAVVLIGRDGGEKHRWPAVVERSQLFAVSDAIPMGRGERAERER